MCDGLEWNGLEDGEKAKGEREKEWERWNQAEEKLLRISLSHERDRAVIVRVSQVGRRGSGGIMTDSIRGPREVEVEKQLKM